VSHALGMDPFELLRRAGIHPTLLDDPESRHAAGPVVELLEVTAAQSGCDSFGTRLSEYRSFANLGPLSLLLEHLPTIDDVIGALVQYRRLMNDIITLECEQENEVGILRWVIDPEYAKPQIVDLVLALGYRILTEVSDRRWYPDAIHFSHASPEDLDRLRNFYPSSRLEFDSEFNGYSFLTSSLAIPTSHPDAIMAGNARRLLNLIALPVEAEPLSNSVRRTIALLLPIGKAALSSVSTSLGLKHRTLQRRLDEESTTFATLLNETRKDLSKQYLANSTHPIGVISQLVGYASQSAFAAWFISEFHIPPTAWRLANSQFSTSGPATELDIYNSSNDNEFVKCFRGSPADF